MSIRLVDRTVTHTHTVEVVTCDVCGVESEVKGGDALGLSPTYIPGFAKRVLYRVVDTSVDPPVAKQMHACDNCEPGLSEMVKSYCDARRPAVSIAPTMPSPEGKH